MSSVEFASAMLREEVAPLGSAANVKARIGLAARRLGWSFSRTKDVWYGDERIRLSCDQMRDIEEATGVRYGRTEINQIDALVSRADALLEGSDPDFHRPFVAALRALVRGEHRT